MRETLITHHEIDGIKTRVTSDTIQAKGYEKWIAVTYMRTNESRIDCCKWYVGLIAKGVIKRG